MFLCSLFNWTFFNSIVTYSHIHRFLPRDYVRVLKLATETVHLLLPMSNVIPCYDHRVTFSTPQKIIRAVHQILTETCREEHPADNLAVFIKMPAGLNK